jgi:peptidoglycan hydrolase CwlO-like protein
MDELIAAAKRLKREITRKDRKIARLQVANTSLGNEAIALRKQMRSLAKELGRANGTNTSLQRTISELQESAKRTARKIVEAPWIVRIPRK